MTFKRLRSPLGLTALGAFALAATGAGAATVHRLAVTQSTGSGSYGATTFLAPSGGALQGQVGPSATTNLSVPFGVYGMYDANSVGVGVAGVSTSAYGVGGASYSATYAALYGLAESDGDALGGLANGAGSAVNADAEGTGLGILSQSAGSDSIDSYSVTDNAAGLYADDGAPDYGYGVYAESDSPAGAGIYSFGSVGLFAESESGTAGFPAVIAASATSGTELYSTVVDTNGDESMNIAYPSANYSGLVTGTTTSDMQLDGDIMLSGGIYTGCPNFPETAPATDCDNFVTSAVARSGNGASVRTYGSRQASPTMEDAGEARLVNGYAHVTLDPTYASSISTKSPYLVFTTPQGDGPGLFVTNRTTTGFDVRQSLGGRSSMTFDYRIVAHPFGDDAHRISFVTAHRQGHVGHVNAKFAAMFQHARNMRAAKHAHPLVHRKVMPGFASLLQKPGLR